MNQTALLATLALIAATAIPTALADDTDLTLPGGGYDADLTGGSATCIPVAPFQVTTMPTDVPDEDIDSPAIPRTQVFPGFGATTPGHDEPEHGVTFDLGNGQQLVVATPPASLAEKDVGLAPIWLGGYPSHTILDGGQLSLGSLRVIFPGADLCVY